jgi:hypothetical protein
MWSKIYDTSVIRGAIEAIIPAGTLILSTVFVLSMALPQPGHAQTSRISAAAAISNTSENRFFPIFKAVYVRRERISSVSMAE